MFKSEYLDMSKIVKSDKIKRLFNAVEDHGGTLRFVGGAVRDCIAGLSGFDLDLATDLSPDELTEACLDYRIKTVPIGLKTATTGVVIDNQILEVASLRTTIRIDNTHREEVYTNDWSADAARRDLTINAVYADLHGNVFDYYDGINDLEQGIVRFIGNPEDRIIEDPLRILRFFRFYSKFGKQEIDKAALNSCIKLKDTLRNISIERVRDELFKLLVTPKAAEVMKIIYDNDILSYFLAVSDHLDALSRLHKIVEDAQYEGNFLRRMFVLYQPNSTQAENIANTLRFTKKQKEIFIKWAKINLSKENMVSAPERLRFVYRYGKQFTIDKILIHTAIYDMGNLRLKDIFNEIENSVVPVFPLKGRDLVNLVSKPEQIGRVLATLEQLWMDKNFIPTREELLQEAAKLSAQ